MNGISTQTITASSILNKISFQIGKLAKIAVISSAAMIGTSALAFDPSAAVYQAIDLADTSTNLANDVMNQCGCRNTAATLNQIANIAVDIEMEARFGTARSTDPHMKKLLYKFKDLKGFISHMHDGALKVQVRRQMGIVVNTLGRNIYGRNWVTATCFAFAPETTTADHNNFEATCPSRDNEEVYTDWEMEQILKNIYSEPSED